MALPHFNPPPTSPRTDSRRRRHSPGIPSIPNRIATTPPTIAHVVSRSPDHPPSATSPLQSRPSIARKELGVWYTPREIVGYMVERVDHLLRSELAQPLGLASPNVRILDPCCGTGAYLTAVLHRIHRTLTEQAGDDPWQVPDQLRTAALNRIFGFEIMPAPFVIAHMEINRLLEEAGAPLPDHQRAGVFLTNALTGWIPETHPQSVLSEEFRREREDSELIKQHGTILVILGNPPYNGYAGIATIKEERHLTTAYRSPVAGLPAPPGTGPQRPLHPLLPHRRTPHRPELRRRGYRLLHLQQRLARRPLPHLHALPLPPRLRPDLHRQPQRRQVPHRQNHPRRQTRPQRLLHRFQPRRHPGRHRHRHLRPQSFESRRVGCPILSDSIIVGKGGVSSRQLDRSPHRPATTSTPSRFHPRPPPRPLGNGQTLHLERESHRELDPTYTNLIRNPALGLPFAQRTVSTNYTTWPRLPELSPSPSQA